MATLPTETQLQTVWSNLVAKLDAVKTFGSSYVTLDNTLSDSLYPDHALAESAATAATRAALASMLGGGGAVQAQFLPLLRTYARVINVPDTDPAAQFQKVYQYMVDTSKTVKSRGITYATPAAGGSNVGVGTVRRLTVDENGFNLEACACELKTIKCVQDEHSGAPKYQETFSLTGTALKKDDLENTASGFNGSASAISGAVSAAIISNPSFDNYSGTAAVPTAITGWTCSDLTKLELGDGSGEYYRDFSGAPTPAGLILKPGTYTVSQALSLRNVQVNPFIPYWFQVAVKRRSSCTGTIQMTVGAQSVSVDLSTLTNDVWTILKIGPTTANWYKNWKADGAAITFTMTSIATGTAIIDDFLFAPFSQFDGTWVAIVGGPTPYLRDDVYTYTDTDGGTGKIQYFAYRAFSRWFPSTGATPTWSDP